MHPPHPTLGSRPYAFTIASLTLSGAVVFGPLGFALFWALTQGVEDGQLLMVPGPLTSGWNVWLMSTVSWIVLALPGALLKTRRQVRDHLAQAEAGPDEPRPR